MDKKQIFESLKSVQKRIKILIIKILLPAIALKNLLFSTDYKRWKYLEETTSWDGRNRLIASKILPNSSVLDLGAGPQTLHHYCINIYYQPCDLFPRTPDTLLCDFNKGIYPEIKQSYDYVVCSGVLEYIKSPRQFLERIGQYGRNLLISYAIMLPYHKKILRLADHGLVNHFTQDKLEEMFTSLGFKWAIFGEWSNQVLYHIKINR